MKWMRFFLIAMLLPVVQTIGNERVFDSSDWKQAIASLQQQLKSASPEALGSLKAKLAITYYKDQQQEKAFQTFLDALDAANIHVPYTISSEEQTFYDEGLKTYLGHHALVSQEVAAQLQQRYAPVMAEHPDYHLLGFLLASAYANLGKYEDFFDLFYSSYSYFPKHFLAYKTKAILHIKIFEREPKGDLREQERAKIVDNLKAAIQSYPQDGSLYKLMLQFAPEALKPSFVETYLNKIIDDNIMVPRTDIPFYVQQAVAKKDFKLAQKFIDKAQEWYQFSRMVNASQEYLNQKLNAQ